MPDIEIHGFSEEEALKLREKIWERFGLLSDRTYINEMIVTIIPSIVTDAKGAHQPFIRLLNSSQEHTYQKHIDGILGVLFSLDIDIEHLVLEAFYPKK